jgi:hypothetical protein
MFDEIILGCEILCGLFSHGELTPPIAPSLPPVGWMGAWFLISLVQLVWKEKRDTLLT